MTNRRLTLILLAMLSCSLSLAGCKDPEKEKAISEAAEAKAELAKLKTDLEKTESERDAIKVSLKNKRRICRILLSSCKTNSKNTLKSPPIQSYMG